jgi:hypothetical protein
MADAIEQKYVLSGHPSVEELKRAQCTVETSNPRDLLADFWPEEEDIDDFLAVLREWRGHAESDQAA